MRLVIFSQPPFLTSQLDPFLVGMLHLQEHQLLRTLISRYLPLFNLRSANSTCHSMRTCKYFSSRSTRLTRNCDVTSFSRPKIILNSRKNKIQAAFANVQFLARGLMFDNPANIKGRIFPDSVCESYFVQKRDELTLFI